jgi:hypothetical protein
MDPLNNQNMTGPRPKFNDAWVDNGNNSEKHSTNTRTGRHRLPADVARTVTPKRVKTATNTMTKNVKPGHPKETNACPKPCSMKR